MVGPNALIVPATNAAMQLTGHAVGAATDAVLGPKEPPKPVSGDAMQAKAEETCAAHKLSEADCARLKASTESATDLALRIQGLQAAADETRARQREEALRPGNIARDVIGGAVGGAVNNELMWMRAGLPVAPMPW
jgi:hypothetical protein